MGSSAKRIFKLKYSTLPTVSGEEITGRQRKLRDQELHDSRSSPNIITVNKERSTYSANTKSVTTLQRLKSGHKTRHVSVVTITIKEEGPMTSS
jgi:hypothetical protein